MTHTEDTTTPLAQAETLAARVSQWLLSLVLAWGIVLGAPILMAASIFEEHPHGHVSLLQVFPSQAAVQAENKRRQPHVFPAVHWRRCGLAVAAAGVAAAPLARTRAYYAPCFGRPPPIPA